MGNPRQRDERFSEAIKKIDAANQEDPRSEMVDGRPQPRELLFAQRVYQWVEQLAEDPLRRVAAGRSRPYAAAVDDSARSLSDDHRRIPPMA